MRNFVVKNDFNKASVHRDRKNDYSRQWDLEDELDDDREDVGRDSCGSQTDGSEEGSE
ncbi:hypothetical protein MOO17_11775 [Escherichia coli]|uniref:hypothetical protein n=1 Tax=Escherichia coli TaxID=562 RepID=UPI001FF6B032|nr:hypothetical protein [Escherichia coli]MCJ8478710.1 hypothetical protein [Escherichia coli]